MPGTGLSASHGLACLLNPHNDPLWSRECVVIPFEGPTFVGSLQALCLIITVGRHKMIDSELRTC